MVNSSFQGFHFPVLESPSSGCERLQVSVKIHNLFNYFTLLFLFVSLSYFKGENGSSTIKLY